MTIPKLQVSVSKGYSNYVLVLHVILLLQVLKPLLRGGYTTDGKVTKMARHESGPFIGRIRGSPPFSPAPKQRARAVTTEEIASRCDETYDCEEQYTHRISPVSNSPVISDEPMFDVLQ